MYLYVNIYISFKRKDKHQNQDQVEMAGSRFENGKRLVQKSALTGHRVLEKNH